MTRSHPSLHSILRILANEYPGEVASLVILDPEEAGTVLGQVLKETPGTGAVDQARRVARNLRNLLGLTVWDTEVVTKLTPAESDKFDQICGLAISPLKPASGPSPYVPSLDEIVSNAIANMAIEGHVLTPAEIESVRAQVRGRMDGQTASAN